VAIHFRISDLPTLYAAWMPFIKGGGLFIPTDKTYALGDVFTVALGLFDKSETQTIHGTVVWLTPFGGQTDRPAGVGIQLKDTEQNQIIKHRIESLLVDYPHNDQPTNTF
jgi:type IV pilus assembly protein PilZ